MYNSYEYTKRGCSKILNVEQEVDKKSLSNDGIEEKSLEKARKPIFKIIMHKERLRKEWQVPYTASHTCKSLRLPHLTALKHSVPGNKKE